MKNIIKRARWIFLVLALVIIVGFGGTLWGVQHYPKFSAQVSETLRSIFGPQFVARIEMTVFDIQDTITKVKYDLGLAKPAAPWQVALQPSVPTISKPSTSYQPTPSVRMHTNALDSTATPSAKTATATQTMAGPVSTSTATRAGDLPGPTPTNTPVPTSTPVPSATATATPTEWTLANLNPLGTLAGEGVWEPYIQNTGGTTVAYRTFVQPDPSRPYAVCAIVAFDLTKTTLHYVLGSTEPYAKGNPPRSGSMASADKAPGVLLAMFNGGFRSDNGQYGAMSDGILALPPIDNFGVVAMYKDGSLRMGNWGTDIVQTSDMVAWRQNGPLVVHLGSINPAIYNKSAEDWGYTVKNVAPTWRSGIGLSNDRHTLYYFAGPSLTIEALANSMVDAGVEEAMQLDINGYWVLFVAAKPGDNTVTFEALFPAMMNDNIDRYYHPYSRDFFYITARP